MSSKVMATLTAIVGGIQVVYVLLLALGVDLSTDLQDAITGVLGLVLVIAGIWFHPDVPFGNTPPPPEG